MDVKNWKWFRIGDYFQEPYKAKAYNAQDLVSCSNKNAKAIAYITRSDINNGFKSFVLNEDFSNVELGNAITVGDTTATIFYQEHNFICGDHMVVLRSEYLNRYVGLFITTLLYKERFRYNYGRAFNKDIIENTLLKLPAIKKSEKYEPDWVWMEQYVKNAEKAILSNRAKDVWQNKFNPKPLSTRKLQLNTNQWKKFSYNDIFEIKKGKRLTKADMLDGSIPYIGAIDSNNGISAYISNDEHLHQGNTITVSYNGSIAEAFYQATKFWATDDVNVLYPKFALNRYIAMFLITLIHREKYRFNYGRKWDKELMESSLIKLPAVKIAPNKYEPDWQFMEDYIKSETLCVDFAIVPEVTDANKTSFEIETGINIDVAISVKK